MRLGLISLAFASALAIAFAGGSIAGTTPDQDGDGRFNLVDNCVNTVNAGVATEPQQDFDRDGFGGECDGDFNQTGTVNTTDFNLFAICFGLVGGNGNPAGLLASGVKCENMDMNGSGILNTTDFNFFAIAFGNGPALDESGLPCANPVNGAPNMTGRLPCTYDPTPND